jgi:hypothetical protein
VHVTTKDAVGVMVADGKDLVLVRVSGAVRISYLDDVAQGKLIGSDANAIAKVAAQIANERAKAE